MEDILFVSKCNHKITNYELNLIKKDDDYIAKLPCPIILDKRFIFIRSWEDQQRYIASLTDYTDIQAIVVNRNTDAPISGIINEIGITDYSFAGNDTLKFSKTGGVYPIDVEKNRIPPTKYLIDFIAVPKTCPRCLGTNIIKDINVNQWGKLTKVTGSDKIKQRVLKALMTPLGMSPYDETFGSELNNLVGDVINETTRIVLQKTIVNCIDNLITNQSSDLSPEERIQTIAGITLDTPDDEKTSLFVTVIVVSATGEYINCSIGFNLGD